MRQIDCSTLYIPMLCYRLGVTPTSTLQAICCLEEGKLIAGALYDVYNTVSIHAHIWIDADHTPSKEWYYIIFDYPFNQLGVHKIIGQVPENNEEAIKLDTHFGFVLEAKIEKYSPNGALLLYTMTKDQCRVLNNKSWGRIGKRVLEAA